MRSANNLAITFAVRFYERRKFFRRGWRRNNGLCTQDLAYLRHVKRFHGLGIQSRHGIDWSRGVDNESAPVDCLELGMAGFGGSGYIRHRVFASFRRNYKRAQLCGFDERRHI